MKTPPCVMKDGSKGQLRVGYAAAGVCAGTERRVKRNWWSAGREWVVVVDTAAAVTQQV